MGTGSNVQGRAKVKMCGKFAKLETWLGIGVDLRWAHLPLDVKQALTWLQPNLRMRARVQMAYSNTFRQQALRLAAGLWLPGIKAHAWSPPM